MTEPDKPRMLIVDDEEGMRRTLKRIMIAKGYNVVVACDGYEAIQRAEEFEPEVLLMDVRMPGLNGVEAYRRMKPFCPDAFAIFMTAYATSELTHDAINEGAVEVLPKPLDIDSLCELLERTASNRPVLIVDDDSGFRSSLQRALTAVGFRVCTASGLEEAVEAFRRQPRSVALLDMKLNGHTGLQVLEQIQELNHNAIAVLMTGFTDLQPEMHDGLSSGACCTFVKPFDVEKLVNEIRSRV